jgi:hypothetical protein
MVATATGMRPAVRRVWYQIRTTPAKPRRSCQSPRCHTLYSAGMPRSQSWIVHCAACPVLRGHKESMQDSLSAPPFLFLHRVANSTGKRTAKRAQKPRWRADPEDRRKHVFTRSSQASRGSCVRLLFKAFAFPRSLKPCPCHQNSGLTFCGPLPSEILW